MPLYHVQHLQKPLCVLLLLCVILGTVVAQLTYPEENAWWSVIYPEFSSADLQQLPAGQEDRLEIRWRVQELWQSVWDEMQPTQTSAWPLSSPASCDLIADLP